MGFQTRLILEKDKELFNSFIEVHPKGHLLQTWEWGEIKSKTGWRPLRLLVEKDGRAVAAVSLLKREIPVLKRNIFYAPRGPVIDIKDSELFMYLLEEIKNLAQKHNVIFLKIDPDVSSDDESWQTALKTAGFKSAEKGEGFEGVQPKYVFRLDITPSEEELMKSFHQKTRYNIRLSERKGVKIKEDCSREDLPDFYRILLETAERDRFLIRSYSYFEDFYDYLVPKGFGKLFMAEYQGKPIAGTLMFKLGKKAWYIYGASSNAARNVMPNYLIQWTMIKWAKSQGCTMYDFRGVPGQLSEDNPLYGLYRFKKGFNGDFTEFIGEYDLVYQPSGYRLYQTLEPIYYKGVRKLIALKKKFKK
ncbi:MAG: peptidoglycan bridge formation glycyltransferase FemA/FemB family protein [Desulfitobacteriaceae bacterium]|nr:peptidoglycan bridge formation glycyltransferase FemA/FemB family protein [Desulfitobacteriaceae bacterium]